MEFRCLICFKLHVQSILWDSPVGNTLTGHQGIAGFGCPEAMFLWVVLAMHHCKNEYSLSLSLAEREWFGVRTGR